MFLDTSVIWFHVFVHSFDTFPGIALKSEILWNRWLSLPLHFLISSCLKTCYAIFTWIQTYKTYDLSYHHLSVGYFPSSFLPAFYWEHLSCPLKLVSCLPEDAKCFHNSILLPASSMQQGWLWSCDSAVSVVPRQYYRVTTDCHWVQEQRLTTHRYKGWKIAKQCKSCVMDRTAKWGCRYPTLNH